MGWIALSLFVMLIGYGIVVRGIHKMTGPDPSRHLGLIVAGDIIGVVAGAAFLALAVRYLLF